MKQCVETRNRTLGTVLGIVVGAACLLGTTGSHPRSSADDWPRPPAPVVLADDWPNAPIPAP